MKHGRRDANQAEIVKALESVGASVLDLADVGRGCPDLLVGYAGREWLIEVKMPTGKLTPDEVALRGAGMARCMWRIAQKRRWP